MSVSMDLGSLSFKNGGGATRYRIWLKKAGDPEYEVYRVVDADDSAWGTLQTVSLSFYGLLPLTTYLWYVDATNTNFDTLNVATSPVWIFSTDDGGIGGGDGRPYYPLRDSLELHRYLVAAANNKLYYET